MLLFSQANSRLLISSKASEPADLSIFSTLIGDAQKWS